MQQEGITRMLPPEETQLQAKELQTRKPLKIKGRATEGSPESRGHCWPAVEWLFPPLLWKEAEVLPFGAWHKAQARGERPPQQPLSQGTGTGTICGTQQRPRS